MEKDMNNIMNTRFLEWLCGDFRKSPSQKVGPFIAIRELKGVNLRVWDCQKNRANAGTEDPNPCSAFWGALNGKRSLSWQAPTSTALGSKALCNFCSQILGTFQLYQRRTRQGPLAMKAGLRKKSILQGVR